MQRITALAAITGALLTLAIAAIPAAAWFNARTPGATQGPIHSGGAAVLTGATGGLILCSKAIGTWHIESSGKVLGRQKTEQFLTKQGPHLGLTISKWEGCQSGPTGLTFTVEPCILQLEQPVKGINKGTFSVATACKIKVPGTGCEFEIGTANNEALKEVNYTAVGLNVEAKVNIEGLTITVPTGKTAECEAIGVATNKEDKLKSVTIAEASELI
jgi:hypothetical protein